MKHYYSLSFAAIGLALLSACGAVQDAADKINNSFNAPGHWLMVSSETSGTVAKAIENESVVLTVKDSKVAFSPVSTVKGKAVYATLSNCTKGPRPYRTEKNDIILAPVAGCAEKRVTVNTLSGDQFKFPDPEDNRVLRVFQRIDDAKFQALVKPEDRKL